MTAACLALAACMPPPPVETGRADYDALCASCHGPAGLGDGPAAAGMSPKPADLSGLSAANGGVFPFVAVMSQIDGFSRPHAGMPEFGALLEGETVLVETEPGVMTPTPARLADLAAYLETLQR
jgi:mono/diheme cytochrome c family protein